MALRGWNLRFSVIDEIAQFAAPAYCEHGNDVNNDCPSCKTYRGMEGDDQLVEIDNKWGYAWSGEFLLEVGDYVVLPSAKKTRRGASSWWVGQVTDFGSSWTGQHTRILRLASGDDLRRWAEIQEAREMARPKRDRYRPRGS